MVREYIMGAMQVTADESRREARGADEAVETPLRGDFHSSLRRHRRDDMIKKIRGGH
jgi:hypothetical protein